MESRLDDNRDRVKGLSKVFKVSDDADRVSNMITILSRIESLVERFLLINGTDPKFENLIELIVSSIKQFIDRYGDDIYSDDSLVYRFRSNVMVPFFGDVFSQSCGDSLIDLAIKDTNFNLQTCGQPERISSIREISGDKVSSLFAHAMGGKMALGLKEVMRDGYRERALFDPLTGLLTRKEGDHRLSNVFNRCKGKKYTEDANDTFGLRDHRSVCVCIIDVDHFKSVNDEYGHPIGDIILRILGDVLKEQTRLMDDIVRRQEKDGVDDDIAEERDAGVRFGGEEFVLIMDDVTVEEAILVVDRLRKEFVKRVRKDSRCCNVKQSFDDEAGIKQFREVSFSAGLTLSRRQENSHRLIYEADRALYAMKKHYGRGGTAFVCPNRDVRAVEEVSGGNRSPILVNINSNCCDTVPLPIKAS